MKKTAFALALAASALFGVGLVANHYGTWGSNYVKSQLTEQKIMMPVEQAFPENPDKCLVKFASTADKPNPMDSGEEAQCYANHYIGVHMEESSAKAGIPGATYGSINSMKPVVAAKAAAADAQKALDDAKKAGVKDTKDLEAAVAKTAAASKVFSDQRTTLMNGSFLRGALLTTYGFSVFAYLGNVAATLLFWAAGLLLLLGFGLLFVKRN